MLNSYVRARGYLVQRLSVRPWYFRVAAHNRRGFGPWSAAARVVPLTATPGAVTNLVTSRGDPQSTNGSPPTWSVVVGWTPPSWRGATAVDSYRVERQVKGATGWTFLASTTALSYSATVDDVTTRYLYRVTAHNGNGYGTPVTAALPGAPAPPENLRSTPGNGDVTVTWTAPADDGGSAVTGYTAWLYQYVQTSPGTWNTQYAGQMTSMSAATLTTRFSGLTNGAAYLVEIHPINRYGSGTAGYAAVIPGVPYGTVVTSATLGGASPAATLVVTWTALTHNPGPALQGYRIDLWDTSDPGAGIVATATAGPTATSWTLQGLSLVPGHTYEVDVYPYNANNATNPEIGYPGYRTFTAP